jgi:DNA-damage-inducible protein J
VDPKTKELAQQIFEQLDITMSEAISLFLKQVVLHGGLPFEVKLPNTLTKQTMEKLEAGKDVHTVTTIEDLLGELNR